MLKLSCRKFSKLVDLGRDRELTLSEEQFVGFHRAHCAECAAIERTCNLALAGLQDAAMEAEPSEHFDRNLVSAFREGRRPTGFGYWSPAVMGAAIAGIAILCAMTIVTRTADSPIRKSKEGSALLWQSDQLHDLNLGNAPTAVR